MSVSYLQSIEFCTVVLFMALCRAAFLPQPHTNAGHHCCLFLSWYKIIAIQLCQVFTAALYSTKPRLQLHILFCVSSPSWKNHLYSRFGVLANAGKVGTWCSFGEMFHCIQAMTILCSLLPVLLGVWWIEYGAIPDGSPDF